MKKFISVAVNNESLNFISDFMGTIDLPKYQINFAILPTGDFVYFTINNKSKIKRNYYRITKMYTLHERLVKLGLIPADKNI